MSKRIEVVYVPYDRELIQLLTGLSLTQKTEKSPYVTLNGITENPLAVLRNNGIFFVYVKNQEVKSGKYHIHDDCGISKGKLSKLSIDTVQAQGRECCLNCWTRYNKS